MLKTNTVFYFDSSDFITISHHYIDQANFSLADKAIKMGLDQHPNNIDLMLLNSELLIFNSKYKEAYKILNFVEEIDPENREVYLQKATIYSKNNLSEEAIDILKRALTFIDDKIEIWNMIAMEFLLLEDFESAIPFFKKCLDSDEEDYQSLYNLIFCYESLGMIDESINELSSVLEKRPYSKIAWHQIGKIYNKQGKFKESISAFDFAIISDDQFVSAYIEKAKVSSEDNNVLDLYVLGFDLNKKLINPTDTLKKNIRTYLSTYKMIGDSVNIKSAFFVNLGIDFEIIALPNFNSNEVLRNCIITLQNYFNIDEWQINEPIILRDVYAVLDNVQGVQTVKNLEFTNKVGGSYSNYRYDIKGATINNVIYPSIDPMVFEVKYPNSDITGKVVNL